MTTSVCLEVHVRGSSSEEKLRNELSGTNIQVLSVEFKTVKESK